MGSVIRLARIRQIRFCSRWLRRLSATPAVFSMIKIIRQLPVARDVLHAVSGYNRIFPTLNDATAAASGYEGGGHYNPNYLKVKIPEADRARPGDYAALFYMQQNLSHISSVFDLGGNVGNLFYCYLKYLAISPEFTWMVYDLPKTIAAGEQIAKERHETRLRFTNQLRDADGADLFITSGSLQYFQQSLPDMIGGFSKKPRYVLINREPLIDAPTCATVVDGETYRLASVLHDRRELIRGLQALEYEIVDSWQIPERSLVVPCYPDRSAHCYSGMFLRRKSIDDV